MEGYPEKLKRTLLLMERKKPGLYSGGEIWGVLQRDEGLGKAEGQKIRVEELHSTLKKLAWG